MPNSLKKDWVEIFVTIIYCNIWKITYYERHIYWKKSKMWPRSKKKNEKELKKNRNKGEANLSKAVCHAFTENGLKSGRKRLFSQKTIIPAFLTAILHRGLNNFIFTSFLLFPYFFGLFSFPSISYYFHIPKNFLNFFPHTGKNRNRRKSNLLP